VSTQLNPIQLRRLLARTIRIALDGGPAHQQLIERWSQADARPDSWYAALTWDGVGAAVGWALTALDLRGVAPPDLEALAAEAYEEARRQCVQQAADLERIGVELHAAGIPLIALKGSALLVGNVLPALGIRWMNDVDILVPEVQLEQAEWVLESLDYLRKTPRDASAPEVFRPYHDTFVGPAAQTVELHWRLGPPRWGEGWDVEGWFARAEPASIPGVQLPSATDLFWHFLVHDARNHAWSSGSLRAALDLTLAARARGFAFPEVLTRLDADPRPEPLLEAVGDAANLSPILASEVEPTPVPRYLRLAGWRDTVGRRHWKTERVSEAIAWGATLERARRYGLWRGVLDRAVRIIPEAVPGHGVGAAIKRAFLTIRHAGFVGALAVSHILSIPASAARRRRQLPNPAPPGTG
jgi:hypothetical protein